MQLYPCLKANGLNGLGDAKTTAYGKIGLSSERIEIWHW